MDKIITGRVWLITGISSGIGRELTSQLLGDGHTVIGIVRNRISVDDLVNLYPDNLFVYEADVTDFMHIDKTVNEILESHNVDIFVSNAGVAYKKKAEDASIKELKEIIDVNLIGSMVFIRACIPYVKSFGGRIIQIGSVSGQAAFENWSYYCASKFGICGFCESIAKELDGYNASIMIVEPGNVYTNLWKKIDNTISNESTLMAGLSIEKICKRIITVSKNVKMPLYLPMGSAASKQMITSINQRLQNHMKMDLLSRDIDYDRPKKKLMIPECLNDRDIYFWTLGTECHNALKLFDWSDLDSKLKGFIDNDIDKQNKYCCGRMISSFVADYFENNKAFFVVFSKKYYCEISEILSAIGYHEKYDYCYWRDLIVNE